VLGIYGTHGLCFLVSMLLYHTHMPGTFGRCSFYTLPQTDMHYVKHKLVKNTLPSHHVKHDDTQAPPKCRRAGMQLKQVDSRHSASTLDILNYAFICTPLLVRFNLCYQSARGKLPHPCSHMSSLLHGMCAMKCFHLPCLEFRDSLVTASALLPISASCGI
jgi:hypothetical protein